jgi:hypothetical protein
MWAPSGCTSATSFTIIISSSPSPTTFAAAACLPPPFSSSSSSSSSSPALSFLLLLLFYTGQTRHLIIVVMTHWWHTSPREPSTNIQTHSRPTLSVVRLAAAIITPPHVRTHWKGLVRPLVGALAEEDEGPALFVLGHQRTVLKVRDETLLALDPRISQFAHLHARHDTR